MHQSNYTKLAHLTHTIMKNHGIGKNISQLDRPKIQVTQDSSGQTAKERANKKEQIMQKIIYWSKAKKMLFWYTVHKA